MKYIVQIARFIVGAVFIFSGFVKLVDPIGSAYKFEEYFGADVLNLEFLIPYALPFSILLIIAELLLGVMLIVGFKPKLTVWGLFTIMLIFLSLTWYSAYFNKVTDCGCFGDAVKLSPWGTFYKNVFFIALIILLVFSVKNIEPLFGKLTATWTTFLAFIFSLFISYYVLQHLPIIDFRPYAVGKNIPAGMIIPKNAKQAVYEDTWIYSVDGEKHEFTTEEKPWTIDGATFVDRKTKVIEKGYEPPIHDFTMEKNGVDLTPELMQKERLMLIVMSDIDNADKSLMPNIEDVTTSAMEEGYDVYAFSASPQDDFDTLKREYGFNFDLLFCDGTTLKTIIRANPGIVTLSKGTITGKWNATDAKKVKID